ncbi:MAG: amidophosphoribosyltransferase [Spirochaetales bacterium]|nr:amidophosphoribosyltransferase [Spirochaetales bacterium]
MEHHEAYPYSESPKHFCGIAGIFSKKEINIPEKLFYALYSLQHRGQESCGIAYRKHNHITAYKDLGMVTTVLSHYLKEDHPSHAGIGHVRYSTHGGSKIENAQPLVATCNKGDIALAHNGNISNSGALQSELFKEGSIFQTTTDTELLLHLIARSKKAAFLDSLKEVLNMVEGAFSIVMIYNNKLIAVRDPYGFRPLVMGEKDGTTVFASETCALDIYGITDMREVKPGELIVVDKESTVSLSYADPGKYRRKAHCIFELIYFARPDSRLFGYSVHEIRKKMGQCLYSIDKNPGELVIPVPDSGNSAAQGYAIASKLPYEQGLTRNHYTGRTFIQPTKAMREFGVKMKLHPVKEAIKGKKLTVVDDSLVRGTTSKTLVKLLKDSGAKEVHLRLSSPEIKFPCFFGIDIPTREELISNRLSPEGIAKEIGADSVSFLPLEQLKKCVKNPEDFCFACFSGEYPVDIQQAEKLQEKEK